MSNKIQLKRNSTTGAVPSTTALSAGEVAINTYDGKLFFKKTVGAVDTIVTLQENPYTAGTGVNISGGTVSIGQDVATSASPDFAGLNISPSGYADSLKVAATGDVTITKNLILPGTITDGLGSHGTNGQVLMSTGSGLRWHTNTGGGGGAALTVRNTMGDGGANLVEVLEVSAINFDYSTGINVTDKGDGEVFVSLGSSFKTIQVDGQDSVVAVGEDTLTLVAGNNIAITTHATAPKSITISSIGSSSPIKTFNVLGDFGLLTGTARFYPVSSDTIRSVILSVGKPVQQDLRMALLKNNEFVQYFTITTGMVYASYSDLTIPIQVNDSFTVNIVAGGGTNMSMALFNINL
jgi:hypothetical protein